jgi:hypothetical protein
MQEGSKYKHESTFTRPNFERWCIKTLCSFFDKASALPPVHRLAFWLIAKALPCHGGRINISEANSFDLFANIFDANNAKSVASLKQILLICSPIYYANNAKGVTSLSTTSEG